MGNCINKKNRGVFIRRMIEKNEKSDNVDFSNNYIGERAMLSWSYCAYCVSCSSVVTNKNNNKHKHKNECHDDDDQQQQQQQRRRPFLICYDKTTETKFIRAACETCIWMNSGFSHGDVHGNICIYNKKSNS